MRLADKLGQILTDSLLAARFFGVEIKIKIKSRSRSKRWGYLPTPA
jgi:hypothetical protein